MTAFILALTIAASTGAVAATAADQLTVAKELYATAAYEEALATLMEARGSVAPSSSEAIQLDQYRVFCLYALGRRAGAETLAQEILRADPFFQPADADASPAIHALFAGVRKQTVPGVVREKYRAAKAAVDRKDFAAAEPLLVDVQKLIAQLTTLGAADDSLVDMGVLADGFLTLGRATVAERPAVRPQPAAVAEAIAPVEAPRKGASAAANTAGAAATAVAYGADSPGVIPPVAIVQGLPPMPELMKRLPRKRGLLEVTIEPTGYVGSVVMRESVNPNYDRLAIEAARGWRYQPATKDGQPVRFVKAIGIELKPE
jgi:TonB family protein